VRSRRGDLVLELSQQLRQQRRLRHPGSVRSALPGESEQPLQKALPAEGRPKLDAGHPLRGGFRDGAGGSDLWKGARLGRASGERRPCITGGRQTLYEVPDRMAQ